MRPVVMMLMFLVLFGLGILWSWQCRRVIEAADRVLASCDKLLRHLQSFMRPRH